MADDDRFLRCPHCGTAAMSRDERGRLGPNVRVACQACGRTVIVPRRQAILASAPLLIAWFGAPLFAWLSPWSLRATVLVLGAAVLAGSGATVLLHRRVALGRAERYGER